MKVLVKKLSLFLGMIFLSATTMAATIDPPKIEKIKNDVNMKIDNGNILRITLAECCDSFEDFYTKKDNALKVLRSGCDNNCKTTTAGDYKFVDFIDRQEKKVARLVINESQKILMLVTYEFNNLK